ncbi:hypothetical protein BTHI11S_02765 [Bosea thiooxidans]
MRWQDACRPATGKTSFSPRLAGETVLRHGNRLLLARRDIDPYDDAELHASAIRRSEPGQARGRTRLPGLLDRPQMARHRNERGRAPIAAGQDAASPRQRRSRRPERLRQQPDAAGAARTIASRSERAWNRRPLSTDHRAFAFARIGAAPAERQHMDRLLVIIPQLDPVAGAKRIAAAFGLPLAEERIVQLLLRGEPPAGIGGTRPDRGDGADLYQAHHAQAGHQSPDRVLPLYILTLSPFVDGCRYPAFPNELESRASLIAVDRLRHARA